MVGENYQQFKLLNLNLQGINLRRKRCYFRQLLIKYQITLFTVQETKLKKESKESFEFIEDLFTIFEARAHQAARGVAIGFLKNQDFDSFEVREANERFLKVNFRYQSYKYSICSYYAPNNASVNKKILEFFINRIKIDDNRLIMAGDFNYNNPMEWGFFKSFCNNANLVNPDLIKNNLKTPTRISRHSATTIDYIYINFSLIGNDSFKVIDNICSDHMALIVDIKLPLEKYNVAKHFNGVFKKPVRYIVPDLDMNIGLYNEIYIIMQDKSIKVDEIYQRWQVKKSKMSQLLQESNKIYVQKRNTQIKLYEELLNSISDYKIVDKEWYWNTKKSLSRLIEKRDKILEFLVIKEIINLKNDYKKFYKLNLFKKKRNIFLA